MSPCRLPAVNRRRLQSAVSKLILGNDSNHCFANASVTALLWAMLSRSDFQFEHWGCRASQVVQFLTMNTDQALFLSQHDWFDGIFTEWHNADIQGDPTEFISFVMKQLPFQGYDMTWERRIQIVDQIQSNDTSAACSPLVLRFPPDLHSQNAPYLSLQTLIDTWHNQDGMITALLDASPLICLQLDRYVHSDDLQVHKSEEPVHSSDEVLIPIFEEGLQVRETAYTIVSAVAHQGMDNAGHCRALLWTEESTTPPAFKFFATDDGVCAECSWREPWWFRSQVVCFWVCRTDLVGLFRRAPMTTVSDLATVERPSDLTRLMQALRAVTERQS